MAASIVPLYRDLSIAGSPRAVLGKVLSGSNAEKIKLLQQQITQLQQQIAMLQAQKKQSSSQAANATGSQPQAKASSGSLGTQVDEYA